MALPRLSRLRSLWRRPCLLRRARTTAKLVRRFAGTQLRFELDRGGHLPWLRATDRARRSGGNPLRASQLRVLGRRSGGVFSIEPRKYAEDRRLGIGDPSPLRTVSRAPFAGAFARALPAFHRVHAMRSGAARRELEFLDGAHSKTSITGVPHRFGGCRSDRRILGDPDPRLHR